MANNKRELSGNDIAALTLLSIIGILGTSCILILIVFATFAPIPVNVIGILVGGYFYFLTTRWFYRMLKSTHNDMVTKYKV